MASTRGAAPHDEATRVLELTQELLARARAGDWDTVAAVEQERRALLPVVCDAATATRFGEYRELLTEILAVDRDIIRLALQHRDELGGQLREMTRGRTALRAYSQNRK